MSASAYEFHSREFGWVKAEPLAVGHRETQNELPRDGTVHLLAQLPNGREVARRHVAFEAHRLRLNERSGRCTLCGLREVDHHAPQVPPYDPRLEEAPRCQICHEFVYLHHPDAVGRVYRVVAEPADRERETEPAAALPTPQTLAETRAQVPRTTRA